MALLLGALLGLTALAIAVIGVVALLNSPRKWQNRWFSIFAAVLAIWMVSNFIDSNAVLDPGWTVFFLKLDLTSALFLAWAFIEFVVSFEVKARTHIIRGRENHLMLVAPLAINVLLSGLILMNFMTVTLVRAGVLEIQYTDLFFVYAAVLVLYFIYGFGLLLYKRGLAYRSNKASLSLIFWGLMVAAGANLLTNVAFPLVIETQSTVQALNILGYVGLVIMTLAIYASITMQHLFDIRGIIVRTLAYLTALASIAGVFLVLTLFASQLILQSGIGKTVERATYAVLAIILAILFPWIKTIFDRITDKLFYQDAYDPQIFLDRLNLVLATNAETKKILQLCSEIIERNVKTEFCLIGIKEARSERYRYMGVGAKDVDFAGISETHVTFPDLLASPVITDYLPPEAYKFHQVLAKNDVAALVRLMPEKSPERSGLDVGYLVLGQKRSGSAFTSQDIRVLRIIANELVIAIQNALHFEEIQKFNVTLQEEVDSATSKLRRTNKRLQELDNIKDDFISMASHQLRTPLTSVKGYLSMVLEGDAGKLNSTQTQMLKQAFTSSQRMVFLITDLLNVSRLKTGKFVIDAAPTDLNEVIEQELAQLEETAGIKNIKLSFTKLPHTLRLMLDEVKIRQVIMNFVDNAIYYTPQSGHIRVELTDKPSTVELRVIDDGIGVPKSEQHHLFTKFYRATNARKTRPDGTGLGLFMAAKVIMAQGGSIIFNSQENKGSTFGFVLPKAKLTPPANTAQLTDTLLGAKLPHEERKATTRLANIR